MNRREQLAWLAGLIDGEGCISLTRRSPAQRPANPTPATRRGFFSRKEKAPEPKSGGRAVRSADSPRRYPFAECRCNAKCHQRGQP